MTGVSMRMRPRTAFLSVCAVMLALLPDRAVPGDRPHLILTGADARAIRAAAGSYPLLDVSLARAHDRVEQALRVPLLVPVPVDAGGPTHEQHKQNYLAMHAAGALFAIAGEERHARFVRDLLLQYARLYPTLGRHPAANQEESAGRLFWQTLNETVWLFHAAQAYDCIHDWLPAEERKVIEEGVLRPMAEFFITVHDRTIDRAHNHGTWMASAVGLLGYALGDRGYVEIALNGTRKDGQGGFLTQIDSLFSPDGYYTEGPYYTRYVLGPFLAFAEAIEHNQPLLRIFERRDSILVRAARAAIQQTTPSGTFIPFNDALKDMSVRSRDFIPTVDIAYAHAHAADDLLGVARMQGEVILAGAGLAVARDAVLRPDRPFVPSSIELRDGPDGNSGAIGLLRTSESGGPMVAAMKYAGQGMNHGHFDRLGIILYHHGREVIRDYGSARFINVETKNGGRYLPENSSWAKQTVAHNTIVVDSTSHYGGMLALAERHPGQRSLFDVRNPRLQIMSARAADVAPDVALRRTIVLMDDSTWEHPLIIDMVRAEAGAQRTYDLPWYYGGHLVHTTVAYTPHDRQRSPLGDGSGYQHLWGEATGNAAGGVQWTWLLGDCYYSVTLAAGPSSRVSFVRIGAHDPSFNLRPEQGVIVRREGTAVSFVSVFEPHGTFDPVTELSLRARSRIASVDVLADGEEGSVIDIRTVDGPRYRLSAVHRDSGMGTMHTLPIPGGMNTWKGNVSVVRLPAPDR